MWAMHVVHEQLTLVYRLRHTRTNKTTRGGDISMITKHNSLNKKTQLFEKKKTPCLGENLYTRRVPAANTPYGSLRLSEKENAADRAGLDRPFFLRKTIEGVFSDAYLNDIF